MALEFEPAADAACLQVGAPHVLSMAPLAATLRTIAEAGVERLRARSLRQTAFLIGLAVDRLARFGVTVVGPYPDHRRGGHIALAHPEALRVSKALRAAGVVVDFRPPNLVRLGPSPLYTSFAECCAAIERLEAIMAAGSYTR
jgi:kynureninase